MRIENEILLDYDDVLIRPKRSMLTSRKDVKLERSFTFRNSNQSYYGIPIMAANMDGVGTFEMARRLGKLGLFTCLSKSYSESALVDFFVTYPRPPANQIAISIGSSLDEFEKFQRVYHVSEGEIQYVCMDVANGYQERFENAVLRMRENFPDLTIIAGNVVSGDMTEQLILNGADIIKVGIGQGGMCLTRTQTGVGVPQLSAVIECADAAHGLGGHIIADGGCSTPGDVAKAFAANSDFVMLGSMLAGHDEGGGDLVTKLYETDEIIITQSGEHRFRDIKNFVQFYGMSSDTANQKHFGGLKDYRASEGRTALVPYRGAVTDTVQEILGGVRSACTYCGASTLKELSKRTTFVRCNNTHNRSYDQYTTGK